MDLSQLRVLILATMRTNVRRLTFWVFAAVFVLIVALLYGGKVGFGGMTATGVKLGVNAEYAIAAMLGAFSFMLMHFTATLCGDPVSNDVRLGVSPLVRASPVGTRTYLIGRFLGGYLSLLSIYAVFLVALILGQLGPSSDDILVLPFRFLPYLRHAFWFVIVPTFFVGAVSFAIGTLTRSMKMVYVFVTALLVGWFLMFTIVGDARLRPFAVYEPSGMVWLDEAIAKSRGNAWLNEHGIGVVTTKLALNRLALLAIGLGALAWTCARYRRTEIETQSSAQPGRLARGFAWLRRKPVPMQDPYRNWVGHATVPQVEPARDGPLLWLAQLAKALATELRLLLSERSLWIMAPVIMLFAGATIASFAGPFSVPVYPVSSEYAQQMVFPLLLFLMGTTIFYTGEVCHRDDASGVRPMLYANPVPSGVVVLSKYGAMVLLSLAMVVLTIATAMTAQALRFFRLDGSLYFDAGPYAAMVGHVVLPSVLVMCAIALMVNVLMRSRYLAYFACIALAACCAWYVGIRGHREHIWNPFLIGHVRYSDLTELEPFELVLRWHHVYWGLGIVVALAASSWFLARTQGGLRSCFAPRTLARTPFWPAIGTVAAAGMVSAGLTIHELGNVRGTRDELERRALAYEDAYFARFEEPALSLRRVDVDVRLRPSERALDVAGALTLENATPEAIREVFFTIDDAYTIRRFDLAGASGPARQDGAVMRFTLNKPLLPGEQTTLDLDWSGVVNPGFSARGGGSSGFIHDRAIFVQSLGAHVLPRMGIDGALFLTNKQRRRDHGRGELKLLQDKAGEPWVRSALGASLAFDYRARIEAPTGLTVLSVGQPSAIEDLGATQRVTWTSDAPVRTFAILAYDYASVRDPHGSVHHHRDHAYNVKTIQDALEQGRRTFEASFSAYPHRELKIAEFPRLADFAQSFPTLMPYSESIGFLTNSKGSERFVDATYFVTAHEVAHQWWAYALHPGESLGAAVLSESLAEYSAMLLLDKERGERTRLVFLKREEDEYLRGRDADEEVALAKVEDEGQVLWYQKGCLVFSMLERRIGREALLAGLSAFISTWQARAQGLVPTFPTVEDLIAELKRRHPRQELGWFYDQWFREVVVPDVKVVQASSRKSGDLWVVDFTATNQRSSDLHRAGRAVIRAELIAGEWNLDAEPSDAFVASPSIELVIEEGEVVSGMLTSTFEPTELILDRFYDCIDFDRTNNRASLGSPFVDAFVTTSRDANARN